jgi:hypothetical protein
MANPTTNYGFVLPTSTDLVTDLPADFDVALQGVDTRLKALQPGTTLGDIAYSSATANTNTRLGIGSTGQVLTVASGVPSWSTPATPASAGLVLINHTTFSAVSSQSLNNVFSSTYTNYQIIILAIPTAGGPDLSLRLRASGTDNTTASSYLQHRDASFSTTSLDADQTSNLFTISSIQDVQCLTTTMLGNPFASLATSILSIGGRAGLTQTVTGHHTATSSFDGFTILPSSSTMTGSVSVYGYSK